MAKSAHNTTNLESENSGLKLLMLNDSRLVVPTLEEKKLLLSYLDYPTIYTRSFDLVRLNVKSIDLVKNKKDFVLIEVKVTSKKLINFPTGFFFGLTKNEETLLQDLEGSFLLCLVSIHPETQQSIYLNYEGLNERIRNKRVQYQINL
jgi:hypothetical protein